MYMKLMIKIHAVLMALIMVSALDSYAQSPSRAEQAVTDIVKKYEESTEVTCMTLVKGGGLEMMKMVLNKEFGKDFMKGVTSITIIDYSDASEETCATIHKEMDVFLSLLQEFDVSKKKQFAEYPYLRCFASSSESNTISDFVIALENDKSKMIMYMAGKIVTK